MPEVTIKYKKPETLKILKSLAKYFDFTISKKKDDAKNEKTETYQINGVTVLPRDKNASLDELRDVFTGSGIDAAELRKAWQRGK